MKLKRLKSTGDVWAIAQDGTRNQIINRETFDRGVIMGLWGNWNTITDVDELTEPEGSAIVLVASD